jgi:hypothetical protein
MTRLFNENSLFTEVYDWIGSSSLTPEYFEIKEYNGVIILPGFLVRSGSYNMVQVSSPVLMSPGGSVAFRGFGSTSVDETDHSVVGNASVEKKEVDFENMIAEVKRIRENEVNKMSDCVVVIRREHIYNDLLKLYKKRNTTKYKLIITFEGEDGVGEGVCKDAYSAFFESMYEFFEGNFEKVPSSNIEEEDLDTIGKIVTHAFITYGVFPLQLCASSVKYYLFQEITDAEVLESFLNFLPRNESEMLRDFPEKGGSTQPVSDILNEYSVFSIPTKETVMKLCIKAGRVALVKNPCFLMQHLVAGMGIFWTKLSEDNIDSIFLLVRPNAESFIAALVTNEQSKQEGKVVTWLHRYIRACTGLELSRLIRFITGSPCLSPNSKIKVEFIDQTIFSLMPRSQTCFKIFLLARQYSSFTMFEKNLNSFLGNSETWKLHDE